MTKNSILVEKSKQKNNFALFISFFNIWQTSCENIKKEEHFAFILFHEESESAIRFQKFSFWNFHFPILLANFTVRNPSQEFWKLFLVADKRLYKRLCPSVGRSDGWSVGPWWSSWESAKTRISTPAHPSATGGRVSGLVLCRIDLFDFLHSPFFSLQINIFHWS